MKERIKASIDAVISGEALLTYRKELMGIAIVWVMVLHCYTNCFRDMHMQILYTICAYGYLGVEFFLFLSGIGLYYSLQKDGRILQFYKRRIIRVVIPWLIISCPYWILKSLIVDRDSFAVFLANWSGVSYWKDGIATVWYITFILVLYAVYPLIFRLQNKYHSAVGIMVGGGYNTQRNSSYIFP